MRERLHGQLAPFVIENVIAAPYDSGIVLCGSMFPLTGATDPDGKPAWAQRHRNFETSWFMFQPACDHEGMYRADRAILTAGGPGVLTYRKRARIVALEMEGPPEVVSEVTDGGPWRGPTLPEWMERIERYVTQQRKVKP